VIFIIIYAYGKDDDGFSRTKRLLLYYRTRAFVTTQSRAAVYIPSDKLALPDFMFNIYIYVTGILFYKTWFFHFVTTRKRADVFFSTCSGNPLLLSTRWWTTRKRFSKLFPYRAGRYLLLCQSRITPICVEIYYIGWQARRRKT